jgi:hypothetical protein
MDDYEPYYGYTFPESLLFGRHTKKTVDLLWVRWMESRIKDTHVFLRLAFSYSPARLESACERAFFYNQVSIPSVMNILEKKWDQLSLSSETDIDGQIRLQF